MSASCSTRPSSEANPPIPPKKPCPNRSPNRPAPMKPAAKPPNSPPPNRPGRVEFPKGVDGRLGWVVLRWIGAAEGAVRVADGTEKVRAPRLPNEPPPPTRASAVPTARVTAVAIAASAISQRWRNMVPDIPACRAVREEGGGLWLERRAGIHRQPPRKRPKRSEYAGNARAL